MRDAGHRPLEQLPLPQDLGGLGFDARSGRGGEVLFDLGALVGLGGECGLGYGKGGDVRV